MMKFKNYELSKREIEVLNLVAKGYTNKKIAESLIIAPSTVFSHIIHIANKLKVNSDKDTNLRVCLVLKWFEIQKTRGIIRKQVNNDR